MPLGGDSVRVVCVPVLVRVWVGLAACDPVAVGDRLAVVAEADGGERDPDSGCVEVSDNVLEAVDSVPLRECLEPVGPSDGVQLHVLETEVALVVRDAVGVCVPGLRVPGRVGLGVWVAVAVAVGEEERAAEAVVLHVGVVLRVWLRVALRLPVPVVL